MQSPNVELLLETEKVRPLKRVEFEKLATEGYFDDERVELLFGVVVPMTPIDASHEESSYRVAKRLRAILGERAQVRGPAAFAATEDSEPVPDILVVPNKDYWDANPGKAHLVVEVSRTSLRRDRGPKVKLYSLSDVDEYWIVNLVHGCVEVYRDRFDGEWRSKTAHHRGETIAMLAFPDVTVEVTAILPPIA